MREFLQGCAFFNLDLDLLHFACFHYLDWEYVWLCQTFLPVMFPVLWFVDYTNAFILSHLAFHGHPITKALMRAGWRPRRDLSLNGIYHLYGPLAAQYMDMYYLTGVMMSLRMLKCDGEAGAQYLAQAPHLKCWEGEHMGYVTDGVRTIERQDIGSAVCMADALLL